VVDQEVDIGGHTTIDAVLFDCGDVLQNEFAIKHVVIRAG
jgi:hypothetical protein